MYVTSLVAITSHMVGTLLALSNWQRLESEKSVALS